MTGPRVDPPVAPRIPTLAEFEQQQYLTGPAARKVVTSPDAAKETVPALSRIPTLAEFNQMQGMTAGAVKKLRIPLLPPLTNDFGDKISMAPRDNTGTTADPRAAGKKLAAFDIKDPTTYANPILRQVIHPMMENPFTTAALGVAPFAVGPAAVSGALAYGATAATAATVGNAASIAAAVGMTAPMVYHIAQYGWQKAKESQMSPEDRAHAEADPERISGESAAVQAAMLGLAPLIHVGVKGYRNLDVSTGMMEAGARAPGEAGAYRFRPGFDDAHRNADFTTTLDPAAANAYAKAGNQPARPKGFTTDAESSRAGAGAKPVEGLEVPETVKAGRVKPVETLPPNATLAEKAAYNEAVREYEAGRLAQEQAELSAARAKDAERIARADAMRPGRRAKATFFESEQGAEVLGMTAARHGLAPDASPYIPETPLDVAWKNGHTATTESFPEGFSMGGKESRIPARSEIPKTARGSDVPVTMPEGLTTENAALAAALKPSRYRTHSTDDLASALLDAQTELETAQAAISRNGEGGAEMQRYYNEIGDLTDYAREIDGNPTYAKAPEKMLASAKNKLAQIEREYALRGVRGDELADVVAGAKEARAERLAMQQEESLSLAMDDPFADPAPVAAPVAAEAGSARGLAPVEGTGEVRTRGLSAGVEAKAVAAKLDAAMGDLPEYRQISMADQATRAAELLDSDPALARRVALGEAPSPDGLLPESVFVAVENRAILEGDVATIRDLATGKLTSEATTMGQRIRALGERDPDSPIAAIKSVVDARSKAVKDVQKSTLETVAEIRERLKGVKVTTDAWDAFIQSLKC